jgi:proteasome accessory factor B
MKANESATSSQGSRRPCRPAQMGMPDIAEEGIPPAHVRLLTFTHYLQSLPSTKFAGLGDIIGAVPEYQRFDAMTDNDQRAFQQMFERDKSHLRECGIVLETDRQGSAYRIDRERSTFKPGLDVSAREVTSLLYIGKVALADPSFLDKEDLRFALTKIRAELVWGPGHAEAPKLDASLPDGTGTKAAAAAHPIDNVHRLRDAILDRKKVTIDYRDSTGKITRKRTIRPYGDFSNNAVWYTVAYDESRDDIRVFRADRIESLRRGNDTSSKPAYTIPASFDVNDYIKLPFQYGPTRFTAVFHINEPIPASIKATASKEGSLQEQGNGSVLWSVEANSYELASRWAIANGPGIVPVNPPELRTCHRETLERMLAHVSKTAGNMGSSATMTAEVCHGTA